LISDTEGGHRLRVFENRVLWKRFLSNRYEVAGYWRRLRDEKLHYPYASRIIIILVNNSRRIRRSGHPAWMAGGGDICAYRT
jgi:hypothetical protein